MYCFIALFSVLATQSRIIKIIQMVTLYKEIQQSYSTDQPPHREKETLNTISQKTYGITQSQKIQPTHGTMDTN